MEDDGFCWGEVDLVFMKALKRFKAVQIVANG